MKIIAYSDSGNSPPAGSSHSRTPSSAVPLLPEDVALSLSFRSHPAPSSDRRAVAYHEAGHAIGALVVGFGFDTVTIEPGYREGHDGHTHFTLGYVSSKKTLKRVPLEHELAVVLAGPIAQARREGNHDYEAVYANERNHIEYILGHISDQNVGVETFLKMQRITRQMVDELWKDIETLADELMKRGTLTEAEVIALCPAAAKYYSTTGPKMEVLCG